DLEHVDKVLSMQDDEVEPVELQEIVEVVTTVKLITKVVTTTSATITAATPQLTTVATPTLTTTPSAARKRNGVVIRDPKKLLHHPQSFILKPNPRTKRHLQIVPNDEDDVYTEATPLALKKCSWSSEGQELEAIRVLWCADYHIHYNTVDFAGREEYALTRFTLDQMLNNVRLKVEEESEVSLELLRFIR
nr:hypothetical protein [Tanacetum cinerariifolium]